MILSFLEGLGKLHPLAVHLPIGLITIFFMYDTYRARKERDKTALILLGTTAIGAFVSVMFGDILAEGGGYDAHILEEHEGQGTFFAWASSIAAFYYWYAQTRNLKDPFYLRVFINLILIVSVSITGHHGGMLTHGVGYLTLSDFLPSGSEIEKTEYKPVSKPDSALWWQDVVYPVLDKKCVSCHNPAKAKGGLALTTLPLLLKGGKDGQILVPGKPDGSLLVQRIILPEDHRLRMPTQKQEGYTASEITLLKYWIQSGASDTTHVKLDNLPKEVVMALSSRFPPPDVPEVLSDLHFAMPASEKIKDLHQIGMEIRELKQGTGLLEAGKALGNANLNAATLLNGIESQVVIFHWPGPGKPEGGWDFLKKMKNLYFLDLPAAKFGDEDVKLISGLEKLTVLGLCKTMVTEKSVPVFETMKGIEKVYLWESGVKQNVKPQSGKPLLIFSDKLTAYGLDSTLLPSYREKHKLKAN